MTALYLIGWAACIALAGYCLLALALTLLQRKLIYKPDPRRVSPAECGLAGIDVVTFDTPDGATIEAWYAPADPGQPTVLYFHGNAGWIELRNERLAELKSRGFGVLMPSYRGYGGSTGRPTEAANVADAKLAYGALLARGLDPSRIVVFGESLGTDVAVQLAAARPVQGVVLDSPFTSMTDIARLRYPWLPVGQLLRDRYETVRHIVSVRAPVLILHGDADLLVPVGMGRAVHAAASGAKALRIYPGSRHLDHVAAGSFDDVAIWMSSIDRAAQKAKRPEAVPQAYVVAKV